MVEEGSEHDGQRAGFHQSLASRFGRYICEGHGNMPREELISAAYRAVLSINSLDVSRRTSEGNVLDLERTYEMRLDGMMASRILHQLPKGVSSRINSDTAEVELYVGERKYSPPYSSKPRKK